MVRLGDGADGVRWVSGDYVPRLSMDLGLQWFTGSRQTRQMGCKAPIGGSPRRGPAVRSSLRSNSSSSNIGAIK